MPPPDAVFRALADPTRRAILKSLRNGPRTSGEIAGSFAVSWPTISRHLAVLRDAGMIAATRDGTSISYELDTTVFHELVEQVLDLVEKRRTNAKSDRVGRHSGRVADGTLRPAPAGRGRHS